MTPSFEMTVVFGGNHSRRRIPDECDFYIRGNGGGAANPVGPVFRRGVAVTGAVARPRKNNRDCVNKR